MYRYTRRYDYESSDIEIVCIQLHLNHQKDIIVIEVYRPPSSGISFFDKLSEVLEVIQSSGLGDNEMFLLGDLNCDFTQDVQSSILSRLKFITGSFNLVQLIDTPTRITDKSSTIIDTVFTTNPENVIEYGCIHCSLSDHFMVYAIRKLHAKNKQQRQLLLGPLKNLRKRNLINR